MRTNTVPFLLAATNLTVGLSIILANPTAAVAQNGGNIDLQAFRPAMDSRGYITVNASQVLGHKEVSFGLVTNWAKNLLTLREGENTYQVTNIISPTLVGAFGLNLKGAGGRSRRVDAVPGHVRRSRTELKQHDTRQPK